jgi:hypothetical protein
MERNLDTPFLTGAYRDMVLIRAFEKKVLDLSVESPPKVVGSVHLCAGQEVVPNRRLLRLGQNARPDRHDLSGPWLGPRLESRSPRGVRRDRAA